MATASSLVEYHRGWMVEVAISKEGFVNICRSPFGEELSDGGFYCRESQAWQAATELVDLFYACYTLKQFLRDCYEDSKLNFEEWQQLSQELDQELP